MSRGFSALELQALNVAVGSTGGGGALPDAVGPYSGRSTYDAEDAGFVYRVNDGTSSDATAGSGNYAWDYVRSGASGTWIGPYRVTGEQGPAGADGADGAGSSISALNGGSEITATLVSLNFAGDGASAVDDGSGNVTVTFTGGVAEAMVPVDAWTRRAFDSAATFTNGDANVDILLPPANWLDEKATSLTYTPVTLDTITGRSITGGTRNWGMTRVASYDGALGAVQAGSTINIDMRVRRDTGTDPLFRLRVGNSVYDPDDPTTHQTFQVNHTTGAISQITGTATVVTTPVSTAVVTNLGSGLYRLQITATVHASANLSGTAVLGWAVNTNDEAWSIAFDDVSIDSTTTVSWSDQDGLDLAGGALVTLDLDSAGGPTDTPLAASVVLQKPATPAATMRPMELATADRTWRASFAIGTNGSVTLALTEPTQGTLTATMDASHEVTAEALAYTIDVAADGTVSLYVNGYAVTTDGTSPCAIAGTQGDLPASGLVLSLGAGTDGTQPFTGELVRARVGTDPRWTPTMESWVDVDGVAPVSGWLYGSSS